MNTSINYSNERIIAYLCYLRDVSRKIISRNGFEKCFLNKTNGWALQFTDMPERINNDDSKYQKLKQCCRYIEGVYDKKAFLGFGAVMGSQSRLYAAPLLYLECEISEDSHAVSIEPNMDTLRLNYDLISALSSTYYGNSEETFDDFNDNERELITGIERELESITAFNAAELANLAGEIFTAFKDKSEAFKGIKRCTESETKSYSFNTERELYENRLLRNKAPRQERSIFEQNLCFINANHFFISAIPDALSTYEALNSFVKTIESDTFDNQALEKLLMNALTDNHTQLDYDENDDEIDNAIDMLVPLSLSGSQIKALKTAWANEISYIQGPPGTGKSHTISALVLTALAMKKTVLVVSQKQAALKVVKDKVEPLLIDNNDKSIGICYYDSAKDARNRLRDYCGLLSEKRAMPLFSRETNDIDRKIALYNEHLCSKKNELLQQEKRLEQILESLRLHNEANETFIKERDRFINDIVHLPEHFTFVPIDFNKYEQALNHVEKLESRRRTLASALYLKKFKDHLVTKLNAAPEWITGRYYDFGEALIKLNAQYGRVKQAEKKITGDASLVRIKIKNINEDIRRIKHELIKLEFRSYVLHTFLSNDKKYSYELDKFKGMLFNVNSKLIQQKMEQIDFNAVISIMPFWAAEIRNLGHLFPLKARMFDFVVVDESSQVNLTEIIPAFYRGKHFCIVGDHAQLSLSASGLTFALKGSYDELCWNKYNDPFLKFNKAKERDLIVSKASILDFIKNSYYTPHIAETMLDEHYRSLPHLARYTSKHFYRDDDHPEGKLLIMTETPQKMSINCFQAVKVQGIRGDDDNPNAKYIREEAGEVVRIVRDLVNPGPASRYRLPPHIDKSQFSIGILSLIRDQVTLIKEMLSDDLSNVNLSNYGIDPDTGLGIGTAEEFQGNERDIMILSLCLDKNARSWGFHQDDKRLNVATSRAKYFTYVVYSPFPSTFNKLSAYIGYACGVIEENGNAQTDLTQLTAAHKILVPLQYDKLESDFERFVCEYLKDYIASKSGVCTITLHNQVNACGQKRLDFVLYNHTNNKHAVIEVDGRFHFETALSKNHTEAHKQRMDILTRAGWNIINTPYFYWYHNGWLCDKEVPLFKKEIERIYAELDRYLC